MDWRIFVNNHVSSPFSSISTNAGDRFVGVGVGKAIMPKGSGMSGFDSCFSKCDPGTFRTFTNISNAFFSVIALGVGIAGRAGDVLRGFFGQNKGGVAVRVIHERTARMRDSCSSCAIVCRSYHIRSLLLTRSRTSGLVIRLSFAPQRDISVRLGVPSSSHGGASGVKPVICGLRGRVLMWRARYVHFFDFCIVVVRTRQGVV